VDQCVKRACFFEHRKARGDRTNASVPAGTFVPAGGRRKFDSCPKAGMEPSLRRRTQIVPHRMSRLRSPIVLQSSNFVEFGLPTAFKA
jgi:hypothetical protein